MDGTDIFFLGLGGGLSRKTLVPEAEGVGPFVDPGPELSFLSVCLFVCVTPTDFICRPIWTNEVSLAFSQPAVVPSLPLIFCTLDNFLPRRERSFLPYVEVPKR